MISRIPRRLGRAFLIGAAALTAALPATAPAHADGLPDPGFTIVAGATALVVTDPQNDFLSPAGVAWGVVGKNVEANGTIGHIDRLFAAAKASASGKPRKSRTAASFGGTRSMRVGRCASTASMTSCA